MKIEFQDHTWQIDASDISNRQAEAIFAHTGLSITKWFDALKEIEGPAGLRPWEALYWLMLQQNAERAAEIGQAGTAMSELEFPLYRFAMAFLEASAAEGPAEEAEPDPTRPAAASAPSRGPVSRKGSGRGGGVKPDG